MNNVLKMDLYRMFRSKVTWLCVLGTIIMMLFSIFMTSSDIDYYTIHQEELVQVEGKADGSEDWGIYIGSVMPAWCRGEEVPIVDLFASNIQSKIMLIFLVVFLVDFVNSENKCRFLQNIAGQVSNRGTIVLSKIVITVIYSVIQLFGVCTIIGISSQIFLGYINLEGLAGSVLFFLMQLLLQIAFGTLVIFIVMLTQSTIASMVIGLLLSSGMIQVLDPLFMGVLDRSRSFSVMYYTLSGNIGRLRADSSTAIYLQAFIIAIVVLAITGFISMHTIQRRDVE